VYAILERGSTTIVVVPFRGIFVSSKNSIALRFTALTFIALACSGSGEAASVQLTPTVTSQTSGTTQLLQAVSVVDENVAWVSGHGATFARTLDGGTTWQAGVVPGPDTLQFRDVHAVDADTAYLLAAGPADMSRIYKTTNGGADWQLQFLNEEPSAFFDCFDFWDSQSGIAFSDAVDGRVIFVRTADGGATWVPVDRSAIPDAAGSEGSFAASGTCLVTYGNSSAWVGSGAGEAARVYRTRDRGDSWTVVETPMAGGTSTTGIASLVFTSEVDGIALGGDIGDPGIHTDNVAVTNDGGETWRLAGRPVFSGAVYGASAVPGLDGTLVAVGPKGLDYTRDYGSTWNSLDTLNYWAVGIAGTGAGWAVGPQGRITKVVFSD
jgi:photosystem II stability/assembly factor-like uncharacterized protein